MEFDVNARLLAMATAYRVLAISLFKSGALNPDTFEEQATRGAGWLERMGDTEASNAMAELVEPLIADFRRFGPGSAG